MAPTGKPVPTKPDLKSLVRQQFDRLTADVVARGEISDEELNKFRQLSELNAALPGPPLNPARHWPVLLLSLGVFLVPAVMISLKVPSVEVQLSLLVSELSWQQQQTGEIIGRVKLEKLTARSFDSVHLPQTRNAPAEELTQPQVIFSTPGSASGKIFLASAQAEIGTRVWVSMSPGKRLAELSMLGADTDIKVNLSGMIEITSGEQRLGERDFGRPRPVKIKAADPNGLDLALGFETAPDISFPPHIKIASLSLQQVETVAVEGLSKRRQVSTVLAGRIFNESMNGQRYELRKGEWLKLDGVDGEIRSMQMTTDGIRLDYHGKVTSISVGSSLNQRNLMPNWLEWFSERHSVKLLWGAFIWLLGTLFGVIKWWNRS